MSRDVTVVIPVERGREWNRERATNFLPGTPIKEVQYDEGEWADALVDGARAASTDLVILSAPDVWFQRQPEAVAFLADLAWNSDVTYGPLFWNHDGKVDVTSQAMFCPNRLGRENYLNPVMCVRRDRLLELGITSGLWDFQRRLLAAGGRFKYVPEAEAARDGDYTDPSPTPVPPDVAASFYYQATPGTAYWRCLLPARHLPGQAIFNLPDRAGDENHRLIFPNHAGAAVFQYVGDASHHLVMKVMKQQGVRVLVEADDDYTNWFKEVMPRAGWSRTAAEAQGKNGYSVEGHRATVELADGVIVTTDRLANRYRKLNENVFVCPNQIDPADWPELVKPDDGVFRVGWFASASHSPDAEIIRPALEWASKQPGVEIVAIGCGVTGSRPWWKNVAFKHYGWSNDLGVYRKFLLELDVGLAPVVRTPWAQGRSDLKALEYAMAGALPIVSDSDPYKDCGVPGVIHCPDPKAFLRAVQWCVESKDEVRQLAREARDYVLAERTVKKNIDRWLTAIQE